MSKRPSCTVRITPRGWIEYDITWAWPGGETLTERRKCPRQTMGAAKLWAKAHEKETYERGPPSKKLSALTWLKFMVEFRRLHYTNGPRGALKPSQVASIESHWKHHIEPFWGWRDLGDTSARLLVEWITLMQGACAVRGKAGKRSDNTINKVAITLNTMLNRAEQWELVPRGLPRAKLFRVAKPEIEFHEQEAYERLIEAAKGCGHAVELAILLGARAGLRAGEIIGLRTSDIGKDKNELLVQRSVWKDKVHAPKSGKPRRIPVSAELADKLRARPDGYVLRGEGAKPITGRQLQGLVRTAELGAGMVGATGKVHKLRHTYASHLVMLGVPIAVVKELLGHSSIETTMRYAHLAPTAKEDAVRALESGGLGEGWATIRKRALIADKSGVSDGD